MKRMLMIVAVTAVVTVVVQPFLPAGALAEAGRAALRAQEPKKIDEFKMTTYQAVFVTKGPKWTDTVSPEAQPVVAAHREYIRELLTSGRAVIIGTLTGPSTSQLRGVYIVAGTPEQAKEIAAADPGVKDGRWAFEILKWMGPEGWFQRPSSEETEKIYFGFLANGPNRSQDEQTAQKLQRAHLDYMDGQAKIGKLVLAGPLLDGGTRRGLIAYRVATKEEAIERASGDPMVKEGRLAVELYEWTIPKGVLK